MRFSTLVRCLIAATWDTIPPFSWCVIFSHINERSNSGSSVHASHVDPLTSASATMMPVNDFAPRLSVLHIFKARYRNGG
jgi:hypothetical protein